MEENKTHADIDESAKKKIAPVSPAIASALLLAAVFAIYAFSYRGSGVALSLAPALPVLAIFGAGAFAYRIIGSSYYSIPYISQNG